MKEREASLKKQSGHTAKQQERKTDDFNNLSCDRDSGSGHCDDAVRGGVYTE
jgi:hypothetical protein